MPQSNPTDDQPIDFSSSFHRFIRRWHVPEDVILIISALLIGLITGLATIGFVRFVYLVTNWSDIIHAQYGDWVGRVGLMGVVGLVVGLISYKLAPEIRGSGIPEVMEAAALRSGWIRTRVIPLKIIATALTIGSGGSAGREGPVVQIGAAIGSSLGRLLHLSSEQVRTLVSCGAAAGIAAAFNAPIAASIFALEGVFGSFNVRSFGTVVISAVAGSIVSHTLFSDQPAFSVPAYALNHPAELLLYALLGILAALVATFFIYIRRLTGQFFAMFPLPFPFLAALGMVLTALISLSFPQWEIRGSGFSWIEDIITSNSNLALQSLLLLILLKIVATCLTLGGGMSGGVFAPCLFIGASLGSLVGISAHALWPTMALYPGAYSIVGMAALLSAAARTPITAVIIVFEMSNDYKLILPLLLATGLSTILAEFLTKETLYTLVLKARGITLKGGRDVDVLDSLLIGEIMTRDVHTVSHDMTLVELSDLFSQTHKHGFVILDADGKLTGVVTITDLDRAVANQLPRRTPVEQIGTRINDLFVAYPDETMGDALMRMGQRGFSRLPVVTHDDPRHVVGLIRQEEIIRSYNMALTRRAELLHRAKRTQIRIDDETEFVDIVLHKKDKAIGKTIEEIGTQLPQDCILISIRRKGKTLIPHGNTVFQTGDDIMAFVASKDFNRLYNCLK